MVVYNEPNKKNTIISNLALDLVILSILYTAIKNNNNR